MNGLTASRRVVCLGLFAASTLSIPMIASAQNADHMQQMMEMARKAQACMANIDQSKLDEMARRAKQMEAEIKQLCDAGQRDEAQDLGIRYGREMSQSYVAKEMRKCSEMMSGALSGMGSSLMPGSGFPNVNGSEHSHICDSY